MTPDWTAISTRVTQIIEVLHLGDEPLSCTALDHASAVLPPSLLMSRERSS
jgi:hypothetical protein